MLEVAFNGLGMWEVRRQTIKTMFMRFQVGIKIRLRHVLEEIYVMSWDNFWICGAMHVSWQIELDETRNLQMCRFGAGILKTTTKLWHVERQVSLSLRPAGICWDSSYTLSKTNDLNIRIKPINLLEENNEVNFHDHGWMFRQDTKSRRKKRQLNWTSSKVRTMICQMLSRDRQKPAEREKYWKLIYLMKCVGYSGWIGSVPTP